MLSPKLQAKTVQPQKVRSAKLKLDLHYRQMEVYQSPHKFRVLCCGRRFGKSQLGKTEIIKRALTYKGAYDRISPPVVLVGMPNLPMAKRVFFRPLCNLLQNHPLVDQINKSECIIHLKGDRPDIVFLGLNDGFGDRVRGLRIWGFVGDEIQAVTRGILDEVIMPAMADTAGSWALLAGTPKGTQNHLYDLTQRANSFEDWAFFHYFTSDNPFVAREEIARAKATLDPRIYRQEYEASFESPPGQVYTCLNSDKLISEIPRFVATYMGIDFGDIHPAIVVAGMTEEKRYVIVDSWHNTSGMPMISDEFCGKAVELAKRWNVHRAFCDPSRPAAIMELRRAGKHHDAPGLERAVRGFNRVNEGCQVVNNLFFGDRLFLHDSQRDFYDELLAYHRKTDEAGTVMDAIEDGQVDHRTDGLRYLCASLEVKHDLSTGKAA